MCSTELLIGIVIIIIGAAIYGIIVYNRKVSKKIQEHYETKQCVGFNPDVGPFDIPPYKSPCFANDLTVTNKNIYSMLDTVAVKVDSELERSRKIDKNLYEMANYNNNKLKSLMEGPVVTGIYDNLTAGRKIISSDDFTISPSLYQPQYFVDTGAITQKIKQSIDAKVTELITKQAGGSELQSVITDSSAFNSSKRETINILTKKLINYYQTTAPGDIVKAIHDNIQQRSNLDDKIKRDLNIRIRTDPEIQAYLKLGASSDFMEGAFVFFRHVLSKNVPAIGACDDKSREIIVGGRICKIFKPDSMVQINYSYILNPNKASTDCATDTDNSSVYTSKTDTYPQWLFQPKDQSSVDDIYCQSPAFAQVACTPSQWDSNKDPFYFKYIGGFNRPENALRCGDSPTELDLPQRVPMAILSLSIDKLIAKCKETVVGNANDVVKRCLPSSAAVSLRCLNIDYDNNKPARNIMHNSNKYYIKDNILRMNVDTNTLRIAGGSIIPRFVYKENVNSPQLFIYGTKANQTIGKWYVLTSDSSTPIQEYSGDSDGNLPDGRKECVCY
jgi:hypothetical protein